MKADRMRLDEDRAGRGGATYKLGSAWPRPAAAGTLRGRWGPVASHSSSCCSAAEEREMLGPKTNVPGSNTCTGLPVLTITYRLVEQLEVQVDGAHARHVVRHPDGLAAQVVAVEGHLGGLRVLGRAELHQPPILRAAVLQGDLQVQ